MNKELIRKLKATFEELYGRTPEGAWFAPGRVNLIGEHTDYNGGHVLPCAIPCGTYGMACRRNDRKLRLYSLNFIEDGVIELPLDELAPGRTGLWTAYPEGTVWAMAQRFGNLPGCGADLMFAGDVPAGSGLSSSASIEVLTGLMIKDLCGAEDLSGIDLAKVGQDGENRYNGVNCGIMDQFASAMGAEDHAIYLNTDSLDYDLVPLRLDETELVITNSRVKHSLASSAYNDRRRECQEALEDLRKDPGLKGRTCLCEISGDELAKACGNIRDRVLHMRALHVISEEERTAKAAEALRKGDLVSLGQLMNESHVSLRDLYQVSCPEIDFLTKLAWMHPGVLGSRITGGGFGGCTISLVEKDSVRGYMETAEKEYAKRYGLRPEFYLVHPGKGAGKIDV